VFIRYWFPVLLWATIIFWGSTDLMSDRQTSRFIGPVLRWLAPDLSEETVDRVRYGVRKAGHLVEYAVFAVLLCRAMRGPPGRERRPWSWRRAGWALVLAVAYAVTDELHQATVATRHGSGWDIVIDAVGAAAGLVGYWIFQRSKLGR
jgi:VanZ family protein